MPFQQWPDYLHPRLRVLKGDVLEDHRHAIPNANQMLTLVGREHSFPLGASVVGSSNEPESGPLDRHGPDLLFDGFHSGRCPPPSRVAGLAAVVRGDAA